MEYMEDYDFTLHYHPGKANVVADALNKKSRGVADARACGIVQAALQGSSSGTLGNMLNEL